LNFSYQVTNFGSTTTPNYYWADRFYLSLDNQLDLNTDLRIGDQSHYGSLAPDASYTSNFSYILPNTLTGSYYLFGITDSNNEVFELDNDNNTFLVATPIVITSKPADLVVVSASAPTKGEAGKAVRVEWTVRNQGTGDTAVSSWTDRVILSKDALVGNGDDIVLGEFSRGEILAPNQSYTRSELVTIPFDAIAGYQVFVVTDVGDSVYEATQENNNNSTGQPLTVTRETADLQVTQVSSPSSGQSGQALTVNWTVKNFGNSTTNINYWYDGVYLSTDNQISNDDILLGYAYRSEALDASEQYSVSRSFNLPNNLQAGNYYTLVRADALNYVYEGSLENNNDKATEGTTAGTSIGVTASPDLVMVSVDAPTTGIGGQNLTVSWTVSNAGTVETGQRSWYEAFYLSRDQVFDRNSDTYLGYSYYTGNLAAGTTYSKTESFRLPQGISGPFYLFAQTDAGYSLYEGTAENNNVAYDPNSVEVSLAQPGDLVVGTITIPANGVTGQNASITYTVTNQGSNAILGNWSDSLYLSKDGQWDINDLFLGQVNNSREVLSGNSYTNTLTAPLPGVVPGDYQVIIRSDIRNQIPESNESNNLKATLDQVKIDIESLTLGTSTTGTLGQGQAVYYRFDVGAGETLRLKLDSASSTATNELYLRYGEVPTRSAFDLGFSEALSPDQEIVVPETQAGTYYVLAYGGNVPNVANYTLTAKELPFEIEKLSSKSGGNVGQITLEVTGAKFDRLTQLQLRQGTNILTPIWQDYIDPTRIRVTFDLAGASVGNYDLRAYSSRSILDVDIDGEKIVEKEVVKGDVTFSNAFEVTGGGGGNLKTNLSLPSAARFNSSFSYLVNVTNTGNNDINVPVLQVTSPNGTPLSLTSYGLSFNSSQEQVMVVGKYRPTVLAPGESINVEMFAKATQEPSSLLDLDVLSNSPNTSLNWKALESYYRDTSADGVWSQTWTNFQGIVGDTWGELHQAMRLAAADLQIADHAKVYAGQDLILDLLARARNGQNSLEGFISNNSNDLIKPGFPVDVPSPLQPNSTLISPSDLIFDGDPYPGSLKLLLKLQAAEDYLNIVWIPALTAKFGLTVGGMWSQYIHTNSSHPAPVYNFTDGDSVVEGNEVATGYKKSEVTQNFVKEIMRLALLAIQQKLLKGELNCDSLPGSIRIADLLEPKYLDSAKCPEKQGIKVGLNWNNPFDIPGNTAGGVGEYGTPPVTFPDTRQLLGNVLLRKNTDQCGKITSIDLTSDFVIWVTDALDFIPGDLGAGIEQAATRPMRFLEEYDWAHDVIFNVNFHPEAVTRTIPGSSSVLKNCNPQKIEPPANPCAPTTPDPCNKPSNVPPDSPDCDPKPPKPVPTVRPRDPNDIIGPAGFGEEKWITASSTLPYIIRFENQSTATAPAQSVTVTHPLDADLDWRTFRLGSFGWGGLTFDVPDNTAFYNQRLDLTATRGYFVDVTAGIDSVKGEAFWTVTTIDPKTGDVPADPLVGFLPPNNTDGIGDGFVNYTIKAKRNVTTGTVIDAKATIVFDTEAPIDTPPIFNTLDLNAPISSVQSLPAVSDNQEFLVQWQGSDDSNGSAIADYTVYVSENGGTFTPWLVDTPLTEANYIGTPGNTYAFYAIATDNAGNIQLSPSSAQAITTITGGTGSIGDFIWLDKNANGIQDIGESGLANVTVKLYDSTNKLISTATTDNSGNYSFSNLTTGDYALEVIAPNTYFFSPQNQGIDSQDSDVNSNSGKTDLFTINAGNNSTWDAGLYQLASLSGQVWNDIDGNAINNSEPKLSGWTVYLDSNNNGQLDTGETSTQTDTNGNYSFINLRPGTYNVAQIVQTGWQQTYPILNITTTASDIALSIPTLDFLTASEPTGSSPSCVEKCIIYYTEAGGAVCG
jgi:hypothetical protein